MAAGLIGSLGTPAWIEDMHFVVGAQMLQNLYVLQDADFLDSCLGATNSSVKTQLTAGLLETFTDSPLGAEEAQFELRSTG